MTETTIAAATPAGADYPPYLNATDLGDGTVRVTIRANSEQKEGVRVCVHGTGDRNYRVGTTCFPGSKGCNNYCNSHPGKRTRERPDGIAMADSPERITYTECGATLSTVLPKADWDDFVATAFVGDGE